MKKLILATLCILFVSLTGLAQTPTPKPADDDVVKISTTLIQVDATVTDKKGEIVTDLKPEDFEVYENGQKQDITNFSFVSAVSAPAASASLSPASKKSAGSSGAVPVPPRELRPEQVRRTIALVVDDLSLSYDSVHFVQQALKKFVETQMQDGDLVAIIRTGGGSGALQQFTSDKRQLYAAIDRVRWNPLGSGGIGAFAAIEPSPLERMKATGTDNISDEQLKDEKRLDRINNDLRENLFANTTLGALNFIIKGMTELPGRKSVMVMSDGFTVYKEDEQGNKDFSVIRDVIQSLTEFANRSSVVIYAVDARGLQTLGFTAADNTTQLSLQSHQEKLADRRNELVDKQDGLRMLTEPTGGLLLIDSNDISGGIKKMLNDQKGYYLLGYAPDSETFDAQKRRFNKLTVKVKRPDLQVRYRSGFFGLTDKEVAPPVNQTPQQQIAAALTSPFAASGIELRLNTLFGNDPRSGEFVRSFLHVAAKDLKFSAGADKTHKATFDVIAVSYTDTGLVADRISENYTISLKDADYQDFLRDGFVYNFIFPVKKPGAYQMRVALRDSGSGRIGSANQFIEVPNLKKGKLTLSGIVLKNVSTEQFQAAHSETASKGTAKEETISAEADTSLRKFKRGTVLQYGYNIYNAKPDSLQNASLTVQTRIFRDGQLLFEGKPAAPANEQKDSQIISSGGALALGSGMPPGDYVLQLVVNDPAKRDKSAPASQWIQFQIVE